MYSTIAPRRNYPSGASHGTPAINISSLRDVFVSSLTPVTFRFALSAFIRGAIGHE